MGRTLTPGARGNVGEFGSDKAASNHNDTFGECIEREKAFVINEVFFARNIQLNRLGTGR